MASSGTAMTGDGTSSGREGIFLMLKHELESMRGGGGSGGGVSMAARHCSVAVRAMFDCERAFPASEAPSAFEKSSGIGAGAAVLGAPGVASHEVSVGWTELGAALRIAFEMMTEAGACSCSVDLCSAWPCRGS